ncbi:cytochrome P450 6k1-like [Thrips palmi]|uniref:Cytochrome P450 6k1-like n=1 Tax=Thrips palmi TaxID=161013 RepID=A0A6P8ZU16_THRPL|nr:cytochrome P450 6k1-like [Thrips palmi]XP_034248783.1 cytochrome P450 6k1-like [Thrips palmi]
MIGWTIAALLAGVGVALYAYLAKVFSYWTKRKVPGPAPTLLTGNFGSNLMGQNSIGDIADKVYKDYPNEPVAGTFVMMQPLLHLHDPEIIKQVLIKDFQDFHGRGIYVETERDPLTAHLFNLSGQRWKELRAKIAPTFSPSKVKYMFETMKECCSQLQDFVDEKIAANGGRYNADIREMQARVSTDVISSVAFGIQSNSLKTPESEFRRIGTKVVEPTVFNSVRLMVLFFLREAAQKFKFSITVNEIESFFTKLVTDTVAYREQNGIERADMLNMLMQLKNKGFISKDAKEGDETEPEDGQPRGKLTMNEMIAQVYIFFIAGFDTTSATTSLTMFELTKHPEIQDKIVEEVQEVLKRHNGELTFDAVSEMTYLDKVVSETLRKYPPLPFLNREVMKAREIPGTKIHVEKGTRIIVPVRALHHDPQYYPEPDKFDPERFSDEAKASRPSQVYLPFGDGPRVCVAQRLGLVQVKTSVAMLLSRFRIEPSEDTPEEVEFAPRSFVPLPKRELRMNLLPRNPIAA